MPKPSIGKFKGPHDVGSEFKFNFSFEKYDENEPTKCHRESNTHKSKKHGKRHQRDLSHLVKSKSKPMIFKKDYK